MNSKMLIYDELKNVSILNTPEFTLNGVKTFGRLVDVYDGDTITCIIPIVFSESVPEYYKFYKFNVRLYGIDTCELKNKNDELKNKAYFAREYVLKYFCGEVDLDLKCTRQSIQEYLDKNVVILWLECLEDDKYGRILANGYAVKANGNQILEKEPKSVSESLIDQQLAVRYVGGTK